MAYTLDKQSKAAVPDARDWLEGFYLRRHTTLSQHDVVGDVNRYYPGGWEQFLADRDCGAVVDPAEIRRARSA